MKPVTKIILLVVAMTLASVLGYLGVVSSDFVVATISSVVGYVIRYKEEQ